MIIEALSLKLGIGIGTLAGSVFGYVVGTHYNGSIADKVVKEVNAHQSKCHAEAMDALEHVMTKILEDNLMTKEELEDLVKDEFSKINING